MMSLLVSTSVSGQSSRRARDGSGFADQCVVRGALCVFLWPAAGGQ